MYGFSRQKSLPASIGLQSKGLPSDADIAVIRKEYTSINTKPLKRKAFKFESSGCVEGGVITYFQNNNNILKIIYTGSIGDGSWITEFYYSSGKLIFCYDKMVGGAAAEKESTVEYRLYVKNDKPIRCMEGKKMVQPDSKASEMIKTAYGLLKAYKTKNFATALCDG